MRVAAETRFNLNPTHHDGERSSVVVCAARLAFSRSTPIGASLASALTEAEHPVRPDTITNDAETMIERLNMMQFP